VRFERRRYPLRLGRKRLVPVLHQTLVPAERDHDADGIVLRVDLTVRIGNKEAYGFTVGRPALLR